MLNKIKNYIIIGISCIAAIFIAYFFGKNKGRQNEKIKIDRKIQKNIMDANAARNNLNDTSFVDKLHRKYGRK